MMTPEIMKQLLPLPEKHKIMIEESKKRIDAIFSGESDRKILIIGPCSIDYEESFFEYGEFIKKINEKVKDEIEIILRFYPGKPRTIGGWKGLVYSAPGEKANMGNGIYGVRAMALRALELGFPLADEMLNAQLIEYVEDYLSYVAVGARSTENQYHREVASGLYVPVGFKNPSSGNIEIMTNSIKAGQTPSHFILRDNVWDTSGNELSHGIIRGGSYTGPNYDETFIREYINNSDAIKNPALIIDASHDNCKLSTGAKDPSLQIEILKRLYNDIIPKLVAMGYDAASLIKGFMVESYIYDGNQKYVNEESVLRGKSLTDPCIGLEKTEELIMEYYRLIKLLKK